MVGGLCPAPNNGFMAIKNYSSNLPINRLFENLQKTLVNHGAKEISFSYADNGKIEAVSFVVSIYNTADERERFLPIRLPARVNQAQKVLAQQYNEGLIRDRKVLDPEQAYRVAWRNILDWTEAQMALLEIGMVKMEEIFLPYVKDASGQTLFEKFEAQGFRALTSGAQEGEIIDL